MSHPTRTFAIVAIIGHIEVTSFSDPYPRFVEVAVTARNSADETVVIRLPIDSRPCVGDVIDVPDAQVREP